MHRILGLPAALIADIERFVCGLRRAAVLAEAAEIDLTAVLAGPAALCRTGRLALATGALHGDGLAVALGEDEQHSRRDQAESRDDQQQDYKAVAPAGIVLSIIGLDLDISVAAGAGTCLLYTSPSPRDA